MYEVEVKVPAEVDAVAERLAALGAEHRLDVRQADTYFDAPHRRFEATDEALRVRREERGGEERARVTYKGPRVGDTGKTRRELETGVDDGDTVEAILRELGFDPVATVEKERTEYRLEGFTVTLDSVAGLGTYVEVEAEAEEAVVAETRDAVFDLVESLGLDPDDEVRTSYLELLLDGRGD